MPLPKDLQSQQFYGAVVSGKKELKDDIPPAFVWSVSNAALKGGKSDEQHVLEITVRNQRFTLATLVPGKITQVNLSLSLFPEDQPIELRSTGSGEIHLTGSLEMLPPDFDDYDEDDLSDVDQLDQGESDGEESDEGPRVTQLPDDDDAAPEEDEDEDEDEGEGEDEDDEEEEEEEEEEDATPSHAGQKNKRAGSAGQPPSKKQKNGVGKASQPQAAKGKPAPQQQPQAKAQTPAKTPSKPAPSQNTPKGAQPQSKPAPTPKSTEKSGGTTVTCPDCPAKFASPVSLQQHQKAKHGKTTA